MPDADLVSKFQQSQDMAMAGELFQRHADLIALICRKYFRDPMDIEDCLMEIFEKLVKELPRHEVKNFKSWLFSLTRNFCLKKLRKTGKEVASDNEGFLEVAQMKETGLNGEPETIDREEIHEQLMQMADGIRTLSPEQKQCIELFYLEKQSYQEVAENTGFSLKQVKSYIQNGKRNLKIYLQKQDVQRKRTDI